jgi:hypothetical protein
MKVRNLRLIGCSQRGCSLDAAILENVLVDGLKTNGQLFQTWGAVFSRVVLRGKIDRLMVSNDVFPSMLIGEDERRKQVEAFRIANSEYYDRVDWALDISQAEFKELDIRGVPSRLIRRDPKTQVVVTRAKALEGGWRSLEFRENLWPVALEGFLRSNEESVILVAAKRHIKFRDYQADLEMLRGAGVAEPD